MADLPLQPRRELWSPAARRVVAMLVLVLAVMIIGMLAPRRAAQPSLVLGGPDREGDYAREAVRVIDAARQRVWVSMYVVRPDDGVVGGLLESLVRAAQRGVDVRICLDRSERDGSLDPKHLDAAAWLRERGVRVILDELKVTTHVKVIVADGRSVLAGSHNWTRAALTTNREASWRVDDPLAAAEVEVWLAGIPGWEGKGR